MDAKNIIISRDWIRLLIVALVLLFAFNVYQLIQIRKINTSELDLQRKNEKLDQTIEKAKLEINMYKGISLNLDKLITEAEGKIKEQERKIAGLSADNYKIKLENNELTAEIDKIKEEYLELIDSLLVSEELNSILVGTISNLHTKILELDEKVYKAALLTADNMVATPLKEKSNGYTAPTAMAKKIDEIKVCFNLLENKIANAGDYKIYMRVLSPDDKLLLNNEDKAEQIRHPETGKNEKISVTHNIAYANTKEYYCLRWHIPHELIPGVYLVELFTRENMLGTTTFTLR